MNRTAFSRLFAAATAICTTLVLFQSVASLAEPQGWSAGARMAKAKLVVTPAKRGI